MSFRFRLKGASLCLALLLALTGCTGPVPSPSLVPSPSPSPKSISPVPAETHEWVTLYFPHRSRPVLVEERRQVVRRGEQPEWVVIKELLRGPQSPDARPALDLSADAARIEIAGAKVMDGNLDLLLSSRAGEALRRAGALGVFAVVNTLATIPRVQRVRFAVEGSNGPYMVEEVDVNQRLEPLWRLVELVPPTVPGDCRTPAPVSERFDYLSRVTAVHVVQAGVAGSHRIADPLLAAAVQAAIAGAQTRPAGEAPHPDPDVELLLTAEGQTWRVLWQSGTFYFVLMHPSEGEVALKAEYDCLPLVAQAVNEALAGGCEVSSIVRPFPDVAMGRTGTSPVWAIDSGSIWRAGEKRKVIWRVWGGTGPLELQIVRSDGSAVEPLSLSNSEGEGSHGLSDFGSLISIPEPGCWTMTARRGQVAGGITVNVR